MYGAPRSTQDLKICSQVVRSNVVVLMRKMIMIIDQFELGDTFDKTETSATNKIWALYDERSVILRAAGG